MVNDVYDYMRSIIFRTAAGLLAIAGAFFLVMSEDAPMEMWGFSGLMGAYAILGNRIGGKPVTPPM
jgi:hypothetical protein